MAYTTINKSTDYFNTVLYTGTEPSNKAVTGVGFQPDWVWIKQRSGTEGHYLADVLRGSSYVLRSNETAVENNRGSNGIQSFDSDGFTAGGGDDINSSGGTFASWNWKAGGAGSSNTDGSINSTVSVNTTSGFSIVKYTGTGANATVGHGLGVAPAMIIVKSRTTVNNWRVGHNGLTDWTYKLNLESNVAESSQANVWNSTAPTSSVFSLGSSSSVNDSGQSFIAYCFAEKTGYSKIGSYGGNGNANGTFIYTGFKPAFILQKRIDNAGSWNILDNKREGYNVDNNRLFPDTTGTENTLDIVDILSNGFKWRATGSNYNNSGETNIYIAFAEQPLIGDNPATAR